MQSLKQVRTQELMPFVVCIRPSNEQWVSDNWIRTRKITVRAVPVDCLYHSIVSLPHYAAGG